MSDEVITSEVFQTRNGECGVVSLAIVLKYYGLIDDAEKYVASKKVFRDGWSVAKIIKEATAEGLVAKAYKYNAKQLRGSFFPAIILWNYNHFIVLESIEENEVKLNDPDAGRISVSHQEFEEKYSGIVIFFIDSGRKNEKKKDIKEDDKCYKNDGTCIVLSNGEVSEKDILAESVVPGTLLVKNLSFSYNDEKYLDSLNFFVDKGETMMIGGRNSSGKTTILKILTGQLKPDSGSVYVTGTPIIVDQDFDNYDESRKRRLLSESRKNGVTLIVASADSSNARYFDKEIVISGGKIVHSLQIAKERAEKDEIVLGRTGYFITRNPNSSFMVTKGRVLVFDVVSYNGEIISKRYLLRAGIGEIIPAMYEENDGYIHYYYLKSDSKSVLLRIENGANDELKSHFKMILDANRQVIHSDILRRRGQTVYEWFREYDLITGYVSDKKFDIEKDLVNGTIYDQVVLSNRSIEKIEVVALLIDEGLENFLHRLPMGVDTIVSANGDDLSYSEKMAILRARAKIHK